MVECKMGACVFSGRAAKACYWPPESLTDKVVSGACPVVVREAANTRGTIIAFLVFIALRGGIK
jgi:hypothetical protein